MPANLTERPVSQRIVSTVEHRSRVVDGSIEVSQLKVTQFIHEWMVPHDDEKRIRRGCDRLSRQPEHA